jgi:hypothetical protein
MGCWVVACPLGPPHVADFLANTCADLVVRKIKKQGVSEEMARK